MSEKQPRDVSYEYSKVVIEDGKKRLYIDYNPDGNGLGSKINGLVSAWRLHPDIDEFSTYFPRGKFWYAKFSDLFDVPGVDRDHPTDGIRTSKWELMLTLEEKLKYRGELFNLPIIPDYVKITNLYHDTPIHIRELFLPFFRKLRFKQEIYSRASASLRGIDLSNAVGVLFREQDYRDKFRVSNVSQYFLYLDKVDRSAPLIVCCQSQETLNLFRNRYGERVIFQEEHYQDQSPERMKEVAVNMVLLSKCPYLIGNDGSCFMEVAWYLGDCKARVTRIKPWNS